MSLQSAVIGAGNVSDRHLSGLRKCPRTELVAICDLDESRAKQAADEYGIEAYFDADSLIREEDLDWLHVCTPVQSHLPLAKKAIDAGIPVMIEKPITDTVAEFEELQAAATEQGVPVSVMHNHRFTPAMRKAMERVESGELGDLWGIDLVHTGDTLPDDANRGGWAFELPGGEFEEGLPHPIYLALAAGGYPESEDAVKATTSLSREYDHDFTYDSAQLQYTTDEGVLCNLKLVSGSIPQRLIMLHGEEKSLTVDLVSQSVVEMDKEYVASSVTRLQNTVDKVSGHVRGAVDNVWKVAKSKRDDSWETESDLMPHYYQIDAEARALTGAGEMPVPLEEGKWTISLIDAIRAEAERTTTTEREPVIAATDD